jgi:hypothetical protein
MVFSGMLHRAALVRTDISKEPGASIIRATKIGEEWCLLGCYAAWLL